jgi:hypothetical protein
VLLKFAEGADKLKKTGKNLESVNPFEQSVTDNKQRVMDFLLTQNILIDETKDCSHLTQLADYKTRASIYEKTKSILGAFWDQENTN